MTTFILVRHGESMANKTKSYAGHIDIPLSEEGFLQAEAVSRYIEENFKVDAVYSSDLSRAYNTIKLFADKCNLAIEKRKELSNAVTIEVTYNYDGDTGKVGTIHFTEDIIRNHSYIFNINVSNVYSSSYAYIWTVKTAYGSYNTQYGIIDDYNKNRDTPVYGQF